jgi:hypothetical protein
MCRFRVCEMWTGKMWLLMSMTRCVEKVITTILLCVELDSVKSRCQLLRSHVTCVALTFEFSIINKIRAAFYGVIGVTR